MSFELNLKGPLAESAYLAGRAVAGCPAFMEKTGNLSEDDCFVNAVVFGEWNPVVEQMPKAVIVNQDFQGLDNNEGLGGFISSGNIVAILYYRADQSIPNESWRELDSYSFIGDMISQLFAQSANLNVEGNQFQGKTLFLKEVSVIGPTRTMEKDRGPNGENDYFDCVLMMQWGQE